MLINLRDVEEPTHYSHRAGHGVPDIVVYPLYNIVGRVKMLSDNS